MRTAVKRTIRHTSTEDILSSLTDSLAFQVQMIMWEDRKSRRAGTRVLATGTDVGLKKAGPLI